MPKLTTPGIDLAWDRMMSNGSAMAERYVLCRMSGEFPHVELPASHYRSLAEAVSVLDHLRETEEKYTAVLENYFEFELCLLQETLRILIFSENLGEVPKHLASRRLINVLTAVRLFLDSLPQHANEIFASDPEKREQVSKAPAIAYDSSLSYRLMEALRNYSQHQSLPVHNWKVQNKVIPSASHGYRDPDFIDVSVTPALDLGKLATSRKFKKGILKELHDDNLELKPHVRMYIEKLGEIQETLRLAARGHEDSALKILTDARQQFSAAYPNEPIFDLVGLQLDHGVKAGEPVQLGGTLTEYLDYLRNRTVQTLAYARWRVLY